MPDVTTEFFTALPERGEGVLPAELRGTIRFDLRRDGGTEQWYVTIDRGQVRTEREANPSGRPAECVVQMRRSVFERLASGQGSVVALTLSNRMTVQGKLPLILLFQRFFPSAPGARDPRSLAVRGSG